ncbi:class 1 fructose-bisphosphatase [Cytophaga hutchinsonii]|uniref:Fructose-1,6-bisphosphatase class 1 n=1 Tax=Cytophaga hutchinsonii (strain ATCC 33406 / DSM 1761 / CIP 103989 / NBRC 15051 / NCIMB 9469 / D465) TaxID=269798 RepID=F16PA_CYTH3|nr:class 1 fructose-bisphosphatase [Cytophaga hutchinsonii]Q11R22.1 RecName: Full=Fructose-1,6-bisphosphatase class 1; Short=FBPase class 1; AltName: Full=D-fructose-1,6-bisphosphate 1-phosphohydrolase class 1 [Cytophaga hutchinsonii ATCC 33406]ABG60142.1 D-fructose 1,6-bisphosphatase [Cytophaga hutchinsonii ATCC 33406]SFX23275.1 D-fructose 1,6-bisphosphatase [Cytophaga hutchinsonii ATCC 33406]
MERNLSTVKTLVQFITESQKHVFGASGDLSKILNDIAVAAKIINREVNKAGLLDILGMEGGMNVQNEEVKKLDVYANDQFISALRSGGQCCAIASEENTDIIPIENNGHSKSNYVVLIDPLDGSSNIDVNVAIGSIFSIYRRVSESGPGETVDCMQVGNKQVAAGYIIYGSSTMMVYTTGDGVNGFTLDPSIGEFCLSHPNLKIPEDGFIYSVNEGNYADFPREIQEYIYYCKTPDFETSRPYSSRYIGSMVADFHRNLIKGGIFMYPATAKYPLGKLRLMYECNPLAFIVEQAGGKAIDGEGRILDIEPTNIHQRTGIIIGSKNMVEKVEAFIQMNVGLNVYRLK